MKLVHLSDLHLGKRVNEFSQIEDQAYILNQIVECIATEQPDAVLIAGDVYDKPVPPIEAVQLLNSFLCDLSRLKKTVCIISGNHDSAERVTFGAALMQSSGIFFAPVYNGSVSPIVLQDTYGPVNVYMLPFIKPAQIRSIFPDESVDSYTDAVRVAISHMQIDITQRNVLVAHQFVTGAVRSESEEISVGGTDNVDVSVFAPFDYVALGHLHGPQHVEKETVRYCGTPLKYSFSECDHKKSVTLVDVLQKGNVQVKTVPLVPLRDLRKIRGTYESVTFKKNYEDTDTSDYVQITLTDENDVPDALAKLRIIYPNLMKLEYDNARTRSNAELEIPQRMEQLSPLDLFCDFYQMQNNQPLSDEQKRYVQKQIENIWETSA